MVSAVTVLFLYTIYRRFCAKKYYIYPDIITMVGWGLNINLVTFFFMWKANFEWQVTHAQKRICTCTCIIDCHAIFFVGAGCRWGKVPGVSFSWRTCLCWSGSTSQCIQGFPAWSYHCIWWGIVSRCACVHACVCVCVCACMRSCVRAHMCVHACVHVHHSMYSKHLFSGYILTCLWLLLFFFSPYVALPLPVLRLNFSQKVC